MHKMFPHPSKLFLLFFQGQWRNDVFNGEGTMLHSSGMTYDGMWENGIPAGKIHLGKGEERGGGENTMLHSSGMMYDGMWENGIPAGRYI